MDKCFTKGELFCLKPTNTLAMWRNVFLINKKPCTIPLNCVICQLSSVIYQVSCMVYICPVETPNISWAGRDHEERFFALRSSGSKTTKNYSLRDLLLATLSVTNPYRFFWGFEWYRSPKRWLCMGVQLDTKTSAQRTAGRPSGARRGRTGTERSVRAEDNSPSCSPDQIHGPGCLFESTNKRIPIQIDGGTNFAVNNRFIRGLSAGLRALFVSDCWPVYRRLLSLQTLVRQGMSENSYTKYIILGMIYNV